MKITYKPLYDQFKYGHSHYIRLTSHAKSFHVTHTKKLWCRFILPPRFTWEDDTLDPSREIWKDEAPGAGGILFQFFLRYHTNFLIILTSRKGEKDLK